MLRLKKKSYPEYEKLQSFIDGLNCYSPVQIHIPQSLLKEISDDLIMLKHAGITLSQITEGIDYIIQKEPGSSDFNRTFELMTHSFRPYNIMHSKHRKIRFYFQVKAQDEITILMIRDQNHAVHDKPEEQELLARASNITQPIYSAPHKASPAYQ
ncbi:hypothetical protein KJI95_10090 [Shewanella sp. JM162201]|uniref:Uncharacterized protein n=1 Tax=Shewanella jiangmenensis TaxID=2837387 RepID=A0ABS5V4X5_9GAMM|nr:hypothetical protein [Shewanella jiangmenensis]MBT1444872.1 hypothetical protein [Shewanella jiangmenensis]